MEHIRDPKDIAPILLRLRQASGASARQTAADMDVNLSSLLTWEKGRVYPTIENLIKALRFYGETATIGWDPDPGPEVQS